MLNRNRLIKIVLIISFITCPISILLSTINVNSNGVELNISPLFYITIILLTSVLFIKTLKQENTIISIIIIFIINCLFVLIIYYLEGTPRFTYNYTAFANTDYILNNGHFNWNDMVYQSWPGIFILTTIFINIIGSGSLATMVLLPLLLNIISLPILYVFIKTITGSNKMAWLGIILSSIFFFGAPSYLLPAALGSVLSLFIFTIYFKLKLLKVDIYYYKILLLIFILALIITHLLTTLFLLSTIISLLIVEWWFTKQRPSFTIPLLATVICITYLVYAIGTYSFNIFISTITNLFNVEATANQVYNMGFNGSYNHMIAVYVRISSAIIIGVYAIIGYVLEIFKERKLTYNNSIAPTWVGAGSSLALVTSYSGEIVSRIFSFSINILYIPIVKMIDNRNCVYLLLLLIIIAPFLSVINSYGNETVDYVSMEEITSYTMVSTHLEDTMTIYTLETRIWQFKYSDYIEMKKYSDDAPLFQNETALYLFSERDIDSAIFLGENKTIIDQVNSINHINTLNKIYSSDNICFYIN